MSQWLRVLVLMEDLGLIPGTYMVAHTVYSSVPGDPSSLEPGMHMVHIHACTQNIHIHRINTFFKRLILKQGLSMLSV